MVRGKQPWRRISAVTVGSYCIDLGHVFGVLASDASVDENSFDKVGGAKRRPGKGYSDEAALLRCPFLIPPFRYS